MIPSRRIPLAGSAPRRAAKRLGETEQSWYIRGKAAVSKFDHFMAGSKGEGQFAAQSRLRDFVADNVARVEGSSPANYLVFGQPDIKNAVHALEDVDRTLQEGSGSPASSSIGASGIGQASPVAPFVCAGAALVVLGTIVYFAFKKS